LPTTALL